MKETFASSADVSFCHPVNLIFTPNKYPEYCFVTEFYRYSVKTSAISETEMLAVVDQPFALCVVVYGGEFGLTISSELHEDFLWYKVKGTWKEHGFGFSFLMNDDHPSPRSTPYDKTFRDQPKQKKKA